jgi:hypothetical protein
MAAAHRPALTVTTTESYPEKIAFAEMRETACSRAHPASLIGPHDYSIHDDGQRIGRIRFATSARPAHIPGKNCDA